MRKLLFVGDPHVKPDELEDCERLFRYILTIAKTEKLDEIVFLGDQYHTHGLIHVEVLAFYKTWFAALQEWTEVTALVGNHDKILGEGKAHSMLAHSNSIHVIDAPTVDPHGFLFMPYMDDPVRFIEECNKYPEQKLLICHQTFDGGQYANGFYAKDGVDPDAVPQDIIISGHIHTPQSFSKVIYVGAPRWLTMADANMDRALWLITFADANASCPSGTSAKIVEQKHFDTSVPCSRIEHVVDREGKTMLLPMTRPQDRLTIDICGSAEFIEERKRFWSGKGKIRTYPTPTVRIKVKESEGIQMAFQKYIDGFQPPNNTPKDKLAKMAEERLK